MGSEFKEKRGENFMNWLKNLLESFKSLSAETILRTIMLIFYFAGGIFITIGAFSLDNYTGYFTLSAFFFITSYIIYHDISKG